VVQTSVNTTVVASAAAADGDNADDASQSDVVSTHPGHLLLSSMGSCSATRSVFNWYHHHHHHLNDFCFLMSFLSVLTRSN